MDSFSLSRICDEPAVVLDTLLVDFVNFVGTCPIYPIKSNQILLCRQDISNSHPIHSLRCLLISDTFNSNVFSTKVREDLSISCLFFAACPPLITSIDPYFRTMNILGTLPAPTPLPLPSPPSQSLSQSELESTDATPTRLPAILRLERTPFPSTFPPELASGRVLEETKLLGASDIVSGPIDNKLFD